MPHGHAWDQLQCPGEVKPLSVHMQGLPSEPVLPWPALENPFIWATAFLVTEQELY